MSAEQSSRIRLEPYGARVRVLWEDGTLLADSDGAVILHEKGYPPRYYLPAQDVRTELLAPSTRETYCPFKGTASYWSLKETAGAEDLAWSYPEPLEGVEQIAGLIAFPQERVRIEEG